MSNQTQSGLITFAIIGGIAIVAAGAVFVPSLINGSTDAASIQTAARVLPVNVAAVTQVDSFEQIRTYTGTIRARSRSDLAFELGGKIAEILVDEGDSVVAEQVIARLDTETLGAQLAALSARLDQAVALMAELDEGPRIEKIRAAKANFLATESDHKNASADLERRRKLLDSKAISDEEFDRAMYVAQSAESRMNAAQEQLKELEAGTRSEQLAAQRAAVNGVKSSILETEVAIRKSNLKAPFDGIVTRRYLDLGGIALPSQPVVKLVENKNLEAWIGLPINKSVEIEIGSTHEIKVRSQSFAATATARIAELDPTTRTQTVIFQLPDDAHRQVVSGQLCEVGIKSVVKVHGFWIPTAAMTRGVRGLWSVLVVLPDGPNHIVQKRDVEILYTDGERVLVRGTLRSGDLIVMDGLHRIVSGQRVTVNHKQMFSAPTIGTEQSNR